MKKLLLPILILATVGASAQNVNIPDVSFKNYLLGQSSINTNNDSEIQVSEAQAFTGTISCGGSLISDMTGLEAFVNLTELYCGGNTLTSLDVSGNTALELLNCGVIATLSSLDLSQNVNLTNLGIEYCGFSSIDLSANILLTELNIRNNQFSSIDLSANVNLEEITFDNNSITSIDLSNNLGLTKVRGNQNLIEQLDLSLHSNLDYLFLSSNNLTSLNVANGNNVNFQTLSGPGGSSTPAFNVTSNPNLTCIQVDDAAYSTTTWTSIDPTASFSESCFGCTVNIPDANFKAYLVGNTFINTNNDTEIQCSEASSYTQNIICDNCGISDLTGVEAFTQAQIVGVRNNQLTSVDLSANTSMIAFYANDNLLSNLSVSSNVNLTELDIADNEIATLDVSANTALVNLYVNANNLTSLDASSNTALRRLRCNDNELVSLNVANGNNLNSVVFSASGNPNLACIQVDDAAWSTTNWTDIDGTASFSENCATVGIEEEETLAFGMYPNPTSGELNFTSKEPIEFIEIFNQVGQQVAVFTNQNAVNITELATGLYTVRITSGTKTGVQRLIKK